MDELRPILSSPADVVNPAARSEYVRHHASGPGCVLSVFRIADPQKPFLCDNTGQSTNNRQ